MKKELIIQQAIEYAKSIFKDDKTGHDFYHTERVYKIATKIAIAEKVDLFVVQLAALLHDVDDYKLSGNNLELLNARNFMFSHGIDNDIVEKICNIIKTMSFKGDQIIKMKTLEGMIVQDSDRLDAIGAIAIARAFTYGGSIGRKIYIPDDKPRSQLTEKDYVSNPGASSINHFYEKLLKLKDLMNTDAARKIAEKRHDFMLEYLKEFFEEWDGIK